MYILAETSYFVGSSFQFLLSVLFIEPNIDDAENDYIISTLQKERQSDARLPFYLIKFTSIKNNNPEVYSCEQGQQGLTLANIGNYLYFCKKNITFNFFLMKYNECLQVLSPARLNKYAQACGNDKAKTLRLYQYNIKLSQRFYGVIGMFEIMLRNAINIHYQGYFHDTNWIINQAHAGGLLEHDAADIQKTQNSYTAMGVYNNDKMVASFTFGFWTYLFTKRNYRVGGKTLLKIFPNKAHGLKQSDIYRELTAIREFRNRIAHHEPICFNAARTIDTTYARSHYNLIRTYIGYMGFDPDSVLRAVEKPDSILNMIDGI